MALILDGSLGITTPAETVQGALTTTGNTILGDATTDTLTVGVTGIVKDASGQVSIGSAAPLLPGGSPSTRGELSINGSTDSFVALGIGGVIKGYIGQTSNGLQLDSEGATTITAVTNGTERMRIDSSGNLLFNSGYGSAATAYGCRAWVNFNGTGTVAVRASGNVSSITDNGTGDYTVNFTTAMPDGNYMATQSTGNNNWGLNAIPAATNGTSSLLLQSTTQYRIYTSAASGGTTNSDTAVVFVAIFR